MKRYIGFLIVAILAMCFSFSAQAIDECMSGAYYSPAKDGEGIELTVLTDSLYGYVYTYHNNLPDWYVFAGNFGDEKYTLYKTIKTSTPWKATSHEVGKMVLDVLDEKHITFTMILQMDLWRNVSFPMCLTNCLTIFEYEKFTELPQSPCLLFSP